MLYLCRPKYLTMSEKEPGKKREPRKRTQTERKYSDSEGFAPKRRYGKSSDASEKPARPGKSYDREAKSENTPKSGTRKNYGERSGRPSSGNMARPSKSRPADENRRFGKQTPETEAGKRSRPVKPERSFREERASTGFERKKPDFERKKPDFERKSFSAHRQEKPKNTEIKDRTDLPNRPDSEQREWKPRRRRIIAIDKTSHGRSKTDKREIIRLNKYLADAGICSRREADELIKAGTVSVNGVIVTELGTKVSIYDKVNYGGQTLRREKLRYVLLNKPKGYITTSDDPFNRKTVMELVRTACEERIYPVGRLDRNTLGLLLLTNDGDLAKKMMHPKHGVTKLYHVFLDKVLTKNDLLQIVEGLELEDGRAEVDAISYVNKDESKKEIGIEIHSGKNRIVRRIFEHLGYQVVKLDRVMLGGLTKLDLPRGKFRHLTSAEISMLMRIK